ncbi:AAA family ATPase [Nocardioides marmoraquaticus]
MPRQAATRDELASVEAAIASLETQREALGEAVVGTALAPLLRRRDELRRPRSETRRLVTVLFADLVDFTVLSRALDAEDTRELVGGYFARWREVIEAHGGVVEKFIGDAVMAVFGLEHSYEDDAHRAVRAALGLLSELPALSEQAVREHGVELHVRVGIDTGEVVVSTLGERGDAFVAVGPTVNRAARLQGAAPVDRVLVSADTQRLLRGAFAVTERELLRLKGIDEPVASYVVTGERRASFRLDPSLGIDGDPVPTVGRDLQLRFLQDRLDDVTEESRWRVVTVVGDAGIGKSRLLWELDRWLSDSSEPYYWFRGRASPVTQDSPLALLRDVVATRLDLQDGDGPEEVRRRFLESFRIALGDREPAERVRRLALDAATWLGWAVEEPGEEQPGRHPQALRDAGTEAVALMLEALGRRASCVVLLEDVQWADEGTLRWLDAAAPYLEGSPVLVVATARPSLLERRPHWGEALAHHARLDLAPLSRRESRQLVRLVLHRVPDLPDDLVSTVVDGAEGNPYYLEELVTWLIDSGVVERGPGDWRVVGDAERRTAVPSTLKGVLQARLDALSPAERGLLRRAAVVGRVFWDDVLQHLDDGRGVPSSEELTATIDGLRRRDVLLERETSRFAGTRELVFKHALLRDVAYDGLLRRHRERFHRQAADWLADAAERSGRGDVLAAVVGQHLERARDDRAAASYLRAAGRALGVYALDEAGELLGRARRLAPADDHALRFDVLARAQQLGDRLGERERQRADLDELASLRLDPERRLRLLVMQAELAFVHSDYDATRARSGEAVQLALGLGRDDLRAEAMLVQGKALTWAEDADAARALLERCVTVAGAAGRPDVVGEATRYLAMVAGNVGDYPLSLQHADRARAVFAELGDAELEGAAAAQLATTLYFTGRYAEALETLEQTLPVFQKAGHVYRETINLGNIAGVAAMLGRYDLADRNARRAIELARGLDDIEATAYNLLILAEVDLFLGRWDDVRRHAGEAVSLSQRVGNHVSEIEGEARLAQVALVHGEIDEAVAQARLAARAAADTASDLDAGQAHLTLGAALVRAGELDEASSELAAASRCFASVDRPVGLRETRVVQARVASLRGDHAAAVALVEPVLPHLDRESMNGTALPATLLRGVVTVLRAADDPRATSALELARSFVHATADQVADPDVRAAYLAIEPNRVLLADDLG